ncbi:COX15/CtaA family protein [Stakelama tenebrarum]|uniref:Heme A synthase n=1 Tax=Stakelama tenebrarum TaxID=2711215 RepID=A0A6G6Y437_9SPHN|nr:COX15/CtaA family protein [Sphingosinithalassobacter tenebrarum]QIG79611.1 heme A synthase [Sphingosinithalassobacter tenebrarum]
MLQPTPIPATARPRALAIWLFAVAALIVTMVVVGGITRLTESGLSITEWQPITGIIPPLTEAQWQAEFLKYQQIPEYQLLNQGMTLAQFKGIFFWEYLHRLLGRLIGFAFFLPLVFFAVRKAIPHGHGWRLVGLLALGGLQGVIGWWMVTSGLTERTDVSHLRLAAHLMLALSILAAIVWEALDLLALHRDPTARPARLMRPAIVVGIVLFIQLLYGAFVAGLNAGLIADDWPLMNGRLVPYEGFALFGISALIDDPAMVHFIHRWWAWVAVAALVLFARQVRAAGGRKASIAIHSAFGIQILLGIATVMTGVAIALAALHQLTGALLVVATVWGAHELGRIR